MIPTTVLKDQFEEMLVFYVLANTFIVIDINGFFPKAATRT